MRISVLKFILLLAAQIAILNYFNFSPYVFVFFLPAMLLCLPPDRGSVRLMLLAFLIGMATDFLVDGRLGMTALALVPVAAVRRRVIRVVFGQELFARGDTLSFSKHGWTKFTWAIMILTAVFLLIYVWADGAGMYPFLPSLLRFAASLLVSTAVSLPIANILLQEN